MSLDFIVYDDKLSYNTVNGKKTLTKSQTDEVIEFIKQRFDPGIKHLDLKDCGYVNVTHNLSKIAEAVDCDCGTLYDVCWKADCKRTNETKDALKKAKEFMIRNELKLMDKFGFESYISLNVFVDDCLEICTKNPDCLVVSYT